MKVNALTKLREDVNNFIGSWNGEDSKFFFEGSQYHENDIGAAEEVIKKLDELEEALADLNI